MLGLLSLVLVTTLANTAESGECVEDQGACFLLQTASYIDITKGSSIHGVSVEALTTTWALHVDPATVMWIAMPTMIVLLSVVMCLAILCYFLFDGKVVIKSSQDTCMLQTSECVDGFVYAVKYSFLIPLSYNMGLLAQWSPGMSSILVTVESAGMLSGIWLGYAIKQSCSYGAIRAFEISNLCVGGMFYVIMAMLLVSGMRGPWLIQYAFPLMRFCSGLLDGGRALHMVTRANTLDEDQIGLSVFLQISSFAGAAFGPWVVGRALTLFFSSVPSKLSSVPSKLTYDEVSIACGLVAGTILLEVLFHLVALPLGREIGKVAEKGENCEATSDDEDVADRKARRRVITLCLILVSVLACLLCSVEMGGTLLLQTRYDLSIGFRSNALSVISLAGALMSIALASNAWLGSILDEWHCLALLFPLACIGLISLFDVNLGISGVGQLIGAEACLYSTLSGAEAILSGVMYSATLSDSSFYGSDQIVCISLVLQHIAQLFAGPLARTLIDHFGRNGYAFSVLSGVIGTTACAIYIGVLRGGTLTRHHESKSLHF